MPEVTTCASCDWIAGPRRIVRFEMVGVQLDKAGDEEVPFHVLTAGGGALGDVGNEAVAQHERAVENAVLQHDAGIGKNGFAGHVRRSFCWLLPRAGRGNGR